MGKRRAWTKADRERLVAAVDAKPADQPAIQVAARMGVPPGTALRWVAEARASASAPPTATAVLLLSDWHIGALIESREMRGMYAYDTDVARYRIEHLRDEARAYLRAMTTFWTIGRLYLLWAGDILDGVHAYGGQRYRLQLQTPGLQRSWALNHIVPFVESLSGSAREVVCIATAGNHPRIGFADDQPDDENHEMRLFQDVARETSHLQNVAWEQHVLGAAFATPEGRSVYVEHGQRVPWGAKASQPTPGTWQHAASKCADEGRLLDVCCWGHRHTPAYLHGRPEVLSNGCLTGYNEYARKGGLRPTLPCQWMFGLSECGLAWVQNIVLGGWPETAPDPRTGVYKGAIEEAAS